MALTPPLVTIGIPAYRAQFLSQCIASALAQTFDDFELVISDDCRDGSVAKVIAQFGDPRIRVVQGPRSGLIDNSAHIWNEARGQFLKYLYDDDFLLPFCVADLITPLQNRPDAPFAFGRRHIVDQAGKITASPTFFNGDRQVTIHSDTALQWIISKMTNPFGEPTNILIRRSAFDGPACLQTYAGVGVRHLLDMAFYMNACALGPCLGAPAYLAVFRMHPEQVTSNRRAPAFSAGVFEWELYLRGSVQLGHVPAQTGLEMLPALRKAYGDYRDAFQEMDLFLAGLPDLERRLKTGETQLVDPAFLKTFAQANAIIDDRLVMPQKNPA